MLGRQTLHVLNKNPVHLKACLPGFCAIWIPKIHWDELNKDFVFLDLGYTHTDYFVGRVLAEA